MSKQDKYTKSARGQECTIRIPNYCKPAPENETTVLCHINGGGAGTKHENIHAAYGCNICHDIVDGRIQINDFSSEEIKLMFLEGMVRTQIIMINRDIIRL